MMMYECNFSFELLLILFHVSSDRPGSQKSGFGSDLEIFSLKNPISDTWSNSISSHYVYYYVAIYL